MHALSTGPSSSPAKNSEVFLASQVSLRLLWTILPAGLAAAPAAFPAVFLHHKGDFDLTAWLISVACVWTAAVCLLLSPAVRSAPAWCRSAAAIGLAAWGPLAVTSTALMARADIALLACALAVTAHAGRRMGCRLAGVLLAGVACGLEATALVWPIGLVWASAGRRQGRGLAWSALAAGAAGVTVVALAGGPLLSGYRMTQAGYALHRDLVLLLPIVLLGLAGHAQSHDGRRHNDYAWWMPGWAAASLLALLAVVATVPLNVRLAALGMWWYAPAGLADLGRMVGRRGPESRTVRAIGLLSLGLLLVLTWGPTAAWLDSALLALAGWLR